MGRVTKAVVIDADPETVMTYLAHVENHPAFIGPLKSVGNLSGPAERPGTTWDWTFVLAGVEFSGRAESLEYVPGRRFKYRTTSGILSTFTYSVDPDGGKSRLTIDVEYDLPKGIVDKIGQAVAERINDHTGESAAENIKAILE